MEICDITLNGIGICTLFIYPILIVFGLFIAFIAFVKISEILPPWWKRLNGIQKFIAGFASVLLFAAIVTLIAGLIVGFENLGNI